ncbi:MAG: hypothetical protein ACYTFW_02630 [Planctomycetota bacterium]|jgi:hypothetical protein
MTILLDNRNESEQTQLGVGWTTILSVSGNVSGDTLIRALATVEFAGALVGEAVVVRILLDSSEVNRDVHIPQVADDHWHTASFQGTVNVLAGSHTLELQHTASTPTQTVKSRHARICIDQR